MSIPLVAAATAATAASAAYLDAKFHLRHDLSAPSATAGPKFIERKFAEDRLLIYHLLEDQANAIPNQPFVDCEGRILTYKQFFDALQPVGNWLMNDLGIERGEVVPFDGVNSIEYLLLWFALDGIGACPAFVNFNLTSAALVHSVKLCDAKIFLVDEAVRGLVAPCEQELADSGVKSVYYSQSSFLTLGDTTPLPQSRRSGIRPEELRSLMYTSGTTGMPKGTRMLTGRELNIARAVAEQLKLSTADKMYTCMPLFHGAGHGLLTTPCIYAGATVCLGRKFSHKTFWPDVCRSEANILQYVGELCRYLVNAPETEWDRKHKVKQAWGNGMRPDVWDRFRDRFGIEVIHELYGATDGMGLTSNFNRGEFSKFALAKRGLIWNLFNGKNEVHAKVDPDTEDLMRDENGFAIECKRGEAGEVLHKLDPETLEASFAGYYKNQEASEKRISRDVFKKGDMWFRSGDMMRQTSDGLVYFVDRLGDTFRWRSENVSTNEVSDIVSQFEQIRECNVYGVQVPHADGRCGCGFITFQDGIDEDNFDWQGLAEWVTAQLPVYARPIFLRAGSEIEYTGTMKMQKGKLKQEGVDLDKIGEDRIYWLPPGKTGSYVRFTKEDWEALKSGQVKL